MIELLWPSFVAQKVKHLPAKQETQVRSLGQEDPLEKEMVIHSSILAMKIPWTVKSGWLQSLGLQSWTQLSDFHFHGKTLLLYTKTCFSSSGCITIPPVPNLASSNNKLLLCHGPVGWESRCGLPGSLTSGSFTGCHEGVGSGCSCLMAGVGQNSFPALLRGLLLRFSYSQAIRQMASIL